MTSLSKIPIIEDEIIPYQRLSGIAGMTSKVSIYNNTNEVLIVSTIDGLKNQINPTPLRGLEKGIYIAVEQCISDNATMDITLQLDNPEHPYYGCYSVSKVGRIDSGMIEVKTLFRIHLDELKKKGGFGYNKKLDCILSILNERLTPYHPYSEKGVEQCLVGQPNEHMNAFGFRILIVDNFDIFNKPYINLGGKVFRVDTVKDLNMKNGVYLIESNSISKSGDPVKQNNEYYPMEDVIADKLPIKFYSTYKEAFEGGNEEHLKLKAQKEIKELENKQKIETLQYEQIIRDNELYRKQMEHERNIESTMRKDYYEERSYQRKDSSEIWKLIPVLVGGAVLVKSLFFK